ncbi:MAG TPA: hypothetical protein VGF16_20440 [Bryobacteraceae bacterium]|jgi:hypothetical protein
MKCPSNAWEEADLLAFSENKLEARQAARLSEHLQSCAVCRTVVEQQRAVWEALDVWEAPAITADFDRRLHRAMEQDAGRWNRWLEPLRLLLARQGLPIAAATCLIVVAGVVSHRPADSGVSPGPAAARVENLQPEQVEHALDDVQMLGDFTRAARPDTGEL